MKRPMTENNVKQAMVPEGAIVMKNDHGTAPGIIIENENKILIMMPGPPREMKPMFDLQVKPFLASKLKGAILSRTLRIAGVGESAMESRVKDLTDKMENPTVAPYAKETEAVLRITAAAETEEKAGELIEPVAEEIYNRFGIDVYAEGETSHAGDGGKTPFGEKSYHSRFGKLYGRPCGVQTHRIPGNFGSIYGGRSNLFQ